MLVGLGTLSLALFVFLSLSITRFTAYHEDA